MKFTLEWFKAALVRMLRTAAQVALGMLTVGMTIREVDWLNVLSVSVVAAVYSFLTSVVTDLPEIGSDGVVHLDEAGDVTGIDIDMASEDVPKNGTLKLRIAESTNVDDVQIYQGKH